VKKYIFLSFILAVCLSYSFAQESEGILSETKITQYVTDETSTLTSSQIKSLETKLSNFEKETSNQLVVYIIATLGGASLEETSYEIAEKNGIGQKGKNNGVLLFIVMNDRKLRIEVGYGLEGALPDALAGQIIRREITPKFKQGKYYEGIDAGVDAIISATKGEYTQDKKYNEEDGDFGVGCCGVPFAILFIFGFFGIFFVTSIIRRIFGLKGKSGKRSSSWWNSGSWTSGSSGSSWSSGSSFSGGGGSFGGGGSSGSW
jgi:uncharacterized protein